MIDWDKISDEEMRQAVVDDIARKRDEYLRQSGRSDTQAANPREAGKRRRESEACAHYSRRQAAHYQQAIDALSALPMPERSSDEPND